MRSIRTKDIQDVVKNSEHEIVEWIKNLISFPSENRPPYGNESAIQNFIIKECEKLGLSVDVFSPEEIKDIQNHPSWLSGRDYSNGRTNVVARWRGKGEGRSVLFSGHSDVAPSEPDDWNICEPYKPLIEKNRIYGRGSADMKGGLGSAFWAIKVLKQMDFEPSGDIIFESIVDEEFAGGNGCLASRLRGYNADMAIIPEPTRMQICPACFGAFFGDLTLKGRAGMPYMGTTIPNPINGAARAVELFKHWQGKWRSENYHPLFVDPGKELNVLLWQTDTSRQKEFIQMGTPLQSRISWIVWCHPGMTEVEFDRRFRTYWEEKAKSDPALKAFEIDLKPTFHFVKPWETPADNPAVQVVTEAFKPHGTVEISGAPFSCDLGIFGEVGGMPSILFGPGGGNLHAPDEWVCIEDIITLTTVFSDTILSWCQKPRIN